MKKFNQRKPTKEESDAMDNYGTPLKPQPELPSDAMDKMKKGGMTKAQKKVGTVMKEFKAGKLSISVDGLLKLEFINEEGVTASYILVGKE